MRAGSATDTWGLYYTGTNSSGGLGAGGSNDANWEVTYASVGGSSYNGNSTYTGSAYVVSGSYIDAGWVRDRFARNDSASGRENGSIRQHDQYRWRLSAGQWHDGHQYRQLSLPLGFYHYRHGQWQGEQ